MTANKARLPPLINWHTLRFCWNGSLPSDARMTWADMERETEIANTARIMQSFADLDNRAQIRRA